MDLYLAGLHSIGSGNKEWILSTKDQRESIKCLESFVYIKDGWADEIIKNGNIDLTTLIKIKKTIIF